MHEAIPDCVNAQIDGADGRNGATATLGQLVGAQCAMLLVRSVFAKVRSGTRASNLARKLQCHARERSRARSRMTAVEHGGLQDGVQLPQREPLVYYMLNKPRSCMSLATDGPFKKSAEGGTVMDYVPAAPRVFPVGRLDYDSEVHLPKRISALHTYSHTHTHLLSLPHRGISTCKQPDTPLYQIP